MTEAGTMAWRPDLSIKVNGWRIYYLGDKPLEAKAVKLVSPQGRYAFIIARDEKVVLPPVVPCDIVVHLRYFFSFRGVYRRCRKHEDHDACFCA